MQKSNLESINLICFMHLQLQSLEHHLKTIGYDISEYDAITPDVAEQENG
jgi:hypothetical protein